MCTYHALRCGENVFNLFFPNVLIMVENFRTILFKIFVLVNVTMSRAKSFFSGSLNAFTIQEVKYLFFVVIKALLGNIHLYIICIYNQEVMNCTVNLLWIFTSLLIVSRYFCVASSDETTYNCERYT